MFTDDHYLAKRITGLHTTLSRTSSGTFLALSVISLAEECEKMMGALVTSKASFMVALDT